MYELKNTTQKTQRATYVLRVLTKPITFEYGIQHGLLCAQDTTEASAKHSEDENGSGRCTKGILPQNNLCTQKGCMSFIHL